MDDVVVYDCDAFTILVDIFFSLLYNNSGEKNKILPNWTGIIYAHARKLTLRYVHGSGND